MISDFGRLLDRVHGVFPMSKTSESVQRRRHGQLNDAWYKRSRFQLRVDARSETELGTLRAYLPTTWNLERAPTISTVTNPDTGIDVVQLTHRIPISTTASSMPISSWAASGSVRPTPTSRPSPTTPSTSSTTTTSSLRPVRHQPDLLYLRRRKRLHCRRCGRTGPRQPRRLAPAVHKCLRECPNCLWRGHLHHRQLRPACGGRRRLHGRLGWHQGGRRLRLRLGGFRRQGSLGCQVLGHLLAVLDGRLG